MTNTEPSTTAGYYLLEYGHGEADHEVGGPYDTIREMAEAHNLSGYPDDGYVIHVEADGSVGTVPSLNPDDLVQGWRQTAIDLGTCVAGDDALYEVTAYYEHPDGRCLDVTYYVFKCRDGADDEGIDHTEHDECEDCRYDIGEVGHSYRRDADGEPLDGPGEDYDCSYPLDVWTEGFDRAKAKVNNLATEDESWKLGQ